MKELVMNDEQTRLLRRFALTKEVRLTFVGEGKKEDVIAGPATILILTDPKRLDEGFVDYIALAKLAEKESLLITFYFDEQAQDEDERYMSMFFRLCRPLKVAWKYAMIKEYAPDIYEERIVQLKEQYDRLTKNTKAEDKDGWENAAIIDLHLILRQDGRFSVNRDVFKGNDEYLDALEEFCCAAPDVSLYQKLADVSREPYTVQLVHEVTEEGQPFTIFSLREIGSIIWQGSLRSVH